MDPRLLRYYNQELGHLREMGAEFAAEFPKIAARLGMDGIAVTDPYVERLLEGVGFLAARVQLKLDAEFPRFTQRLLEIVYPNFLAPTPSMLIAQLRPDLTDTNLAGGFVVARGSSMRGQLAKGDMTACEFRTAHDVTLWPIELTHAEYFTVAPDLPMSSLAAGNRVKGGLRLRLKTAVGLKFNQLALDRLRIYLSGSDEVAYRLHELNAGATLGAAVSPIKKPGAWRLVVPPQQVKPVGYRDDEAMLPVGLRNFQGYRLIQEYFALPQRFRFIDVEGLAPAVRSHDSDELELVLFFSRGDAALEKIVDAGNVSLFCTPAINLFAKRADRVHLEENNHEYHVVADRTRPMDFEIYELTEVTGYGVGQDSEQAFLPLYAAYHEENEAHNAYFNINREPRVVSAAQKTGGARSSYIGSEVFLSLADPNEAPYRSDLRQLSVNTLCTNRDLPLAMPLGLGKTDFHLDSAAPVLSIRSIHGPSRPYSPLAEGAIAWQLISHLSFNYLSLLDASEQEGAAALREILELYAVNADASVRKQLEGVRSVRVKPITRRLPMPGPITFGRGLEVTLTLDEFAFQGGSAFLLASVLEQFFARYATINSFTESVLQSTTRGEVMRWRARCGNRPIV